MFHPFDTAAKRLMSWEGRIIVSGQTMTNLNNAVFRKQASAAPLAKWMSLFPGVSFGAAYKVLQRAYKFGGQPFVRDYLTTYHKDFFDDSFGKRNGKTMIYATAGSIMGVGEIVLLPLDVLKIKAQTNPEAHAEVETASRLGAICTIRVSISSFGLCETSIEIARADGTDPIEILALEQSTVRVH